MKAHSYRLGGFDEEGMKVVTSNAGLASLSGAWVGLARVGEMFAVDWLEITDGIPTIHFELPDEIDFDAFVLGGIEYFPDTGKIRRLYFVRRMTAWTSPQS